MIKECEVGKLYEGGKMSEDDENANGTKMWEMNHVGMKTQNKYSETRSKD